MRIPSRLASQVRRHLIRGAIEVTRSRYTSIIRVFTFSMRTQPFPDG